MAPIKPTLAKRAPRGMEMARLGSREMREFVAREEPMTKEEAWLMWMKESKHYVEYDWDTIKKSSHWEAFSRGWDAATVNVNGWEDAYKMGMEAGKEMEKNNAI